MKLTILLSVLVAVMGYATCRNLSNKTKVESTQASDITPEEGKKTNHKAAHVFDFEHPDSAAPIQIKTAPKLVHVPLERLKPASASRKAYLSTGFWNPNMALSSSDSTVHENYARKWLKFREDQTFDILIGNQVVDTGLWNWDDHKNEIYLACKDPYINNTWSVIEKGFIMIWKGNTDVNFTGIQVRVVMSQKPR